MSIEELSRLRNLGAKSAASLIQAGIHSADQIQKMGAVATYLRVKSVSPKISLNLLWAIEGFLLDIDWRDLTDIQKENLLEVLKSA